METAEDKRPVMASERMNMVPPNYEKLYHLDDPLATQPFRLEPYDDDWLGRAEATRLLRGQLPPQLPLKLRPAMGGRFVDLMWSTYSPITVISQHLVDLLTTLGFTGWSIYDVEVKDKEGQIKSNYHGLSITGKAGNRDLRRVQAVEKPPVVSGGPSYIDLKGIYFENDGWDGSDFCLMGHTITCIVTDRVVQAFRQAKIRNVQFIQLTRVETSANVYEIQGLWPLKE
jgi:hypothetical protein